MRLKPKPEPVVADGHDDPFDLLAEAFGLVMPSLDVPPPVEADAPEPADKSVGKPGRGRRRPPVP
jgi:hypothetical protein